MAKVKLRHEKYVNGAVANLTGVTAEVAAEASRIGGRARRFLAEHHHDGDAKIEVHTNLKGKYGRIDAEVDLVDTGKHIAAAAIEFGHVQKLFGDKIIGYTPGLYILHRASGLM